MGQLADGRDLLFCTEASSALEEGDLMQDLLSKSRLEELARMFRNQGPSDPDPWGIMGAAGGLQDRIEDYVEQCMRRTRSRVLGVCAHESQLIARIRERFAAIETFRRSIRNFCERSAINEARGQLNLAIQRHNSHLLELRQSHYAHFEDATVTADDLDLFSARLQALRGPAAAEHSQFDFVRGVNNGVLANWLDKQLFDLNERFDVFLNQRGFEAPEDIHRTSDQGHLDRAQAFFSTRLKELLQGYNDTSSSLCAHLNESQSEMDTAVRKHFASKGELKRCAAFGDTPPCLRVNDFHNALLEGTYCELLERVCHGHATLMSVLKSKASSLFGDLEDLLHIVRSCNLLPELHTFLDGGSQN